MEMGDVGPGDTVAIWGSGALYSALTCSRASALQNFLILLDAPDELNGYLCMKGTTSIILHRFAILVNVHMAPATKPRHPANVYSVAALAG